MTESQLFIKLIHIFSLKEGDLINQDIYFGPKGVRIRGIIKDICATYSRKSLIQTSVIQIFTYLNPQNNDIHRYFAVH